jgi:general secretion pathway protein C
MTVSPQYLVAVNLALLALAAYSASAIVGTVLGAKLMPPPAVEISPPPPPIPQEGNKPEAYYALIHQRDIFNSTGPAAAPTAVPVIEKTPLKLKLWGVALHEDGTSYAIIEDLTQRKQDLYPVSAEVPGGATVKSIEWDRVVLSRNGQDEILDLEQGVGAPNLPSRLARPAIGRPATADAHIQEVSQNEYVIDRSEVDSALENMSQLFTQIRAVPHFEGGKATGFRLFAIRSGSLFDKIGLKNGDIIQSINGSPMNDPSRAMALFQELRNQNDLTVEVIRNRQPQTLTYSFR